MGENWFTLLEHHVTFAGVIGILGGVARYWLKERDVLKRVKARVNTLWWDRCAKHQEPYVPVENGIPAVVPGIQAWYPGECLLLAAGGVEVQANIPWVIAGAVGT